jgi:hypothetical protein
VSLQSIKKAVEIIITGGGGLISDLKKILKRFDMN